MDSTAYRNILVKNMRDRQAHVVWTDSRVEEKYFNPAFCSSKWVFAITPYNLLQPEYIEDYYTNPTEKDNNPKYDLVYMRNLNLTDRKSVYADSIGKTTLFAYENAGISMRDFYEEQLDLCNANRHFQAVEDEPGYYADYRNVYRTIRYNPDNTIIDDTTYETTGEVSELTDLSGSYYSVVVSEGDPGDFFVSKRETKNQFYTPKISTYPSSMAYKQQDFIEEVRTFCRSRFSSSKLPEAIYKYDVIHQTTIFDSTELEVPIPSEPTYTLDSEGNYLNGYEQWRHSTKYKVLTWGELFTLNPKPSTWL